jgi:PHD/YefM family antitoxin component YafN of YafNO toxin-antitoxin module
MAIGATLDISEARRQFNSLDERLESEQVIYVTRHNKAAFALVDTEYLCAMMETIEIISDPRSLEMFQQSIADIRAGKLHDHDDVEKELG